MSESEQAAAAAVALPGGRVVVVPSGPDREPVDVPASAVQVRADLLDHVQRGEHGTRRRMKLADVLLYREVDQARRLRAVADLAAEAQDLGLC